MSILLLLLLTRFLTLYRVNLERVTSCEKKPSKPELNQLFHDVKYSIIHFFIQKQLSRGVFRKLYSENLQPIYKRTTMPKSDFNKVEKHLWWTASDFFFSVQSRLPHTGMKYIWEYMGCIIMNNVMSIATDTKSSVH